MINIKSQHSIENPISMLLPTCFLPNFMLFLFLAEYSEIILLLDSVNNLITIVSLSSVYSYLLPLLLYCIYLLPTPVVEDRTQRGLIYLYQ